MKRVVCRVCGKTKPVTEFDLRSDTKKVSSECKECRRERVRVRARVWGRANPERARERAAQWRAALKQEVWAAYGNACTCCGETEIVFLALDHVDGGGAEHRRRLRGQEGWSPRDSRGSSSQFWYAVKKAGFPSEYQLLCHNCNIAKHRLGECPHATARRLRSA